MVIGVISAFASLGAIVCAGVVPLLLKTPWGWRSIYFVGIVPLVILAFARRGLRETARFEAMGSPPKTPLLRIWRTPQARRVVQVGLVWGLTYLCTNTAVYYWKLWATRDAGLSASQAGASISIAAVLSMPLVFYAGKLIDQIGRKKGAVIIFGAGAIGTLGCYGLDGQWPLTAALVFGIFGVSAVLPVLNAFTAELFPTELRGDAFAWTNNLIGRVGYVSAPYLVGLLAEHTSLGIAVRLTIVGPMIALALILILLPETSGKELEEIGEAA
jgi:putative MFS transporter